MSTRSLQASAGSVAVLALSFAGFICLGLPDGNLGVAWPSIRTLFAREQADFGLILLVHGSTYFSSGLLAARLSHRLTTATLLSAGSLIVTMGMLAVASAPHWLMLLAAVALIGVGSGIINTTINTYASQNFSPRNVNWLHACYSLGASLGPLVMTAVIARQATWQWGYVLVALGPAAMAAIYVLNAGQWRVSHVEPETIVTAAGVRFGPLLVRHMLLFFCYSGLELTLGRWCYTVLTELRGLNEEPAGIASSCYFGGIFAGRLLLGAAVERVGATRLVRVSSLLAVVGTATFAFASEIFAAVGLVLSGLALAPIFPTLIAQASGRFPRTRLARTIALCVAAAILGSAVAPYLAGAATAVTGLAAIPATALVLAVALLVLHESIVRR